MGKKYRYGVKYFETGTDRCGSYVLHHPGRTSIVFKVIGMWRGEFVDRYVLKKPSELALDESWEMLQGYKRGAEREMDWVVRWKIKKLKRHETVLV
jgi:hypothetical protein